MNENVKDGNQQVSIHEQQTDTMGRKQSKEPVKKSSLTLRELTIVGLLAAITIILGLSGYGIMALGPLNVTTLHVPTLIGALVEGPKVGAFVGLIFGMYSFWQNFTAPNILSPLFINPLVSVLPRVLFPVLAVLVYKSLWKVPQGPRLIVFRIHGHYIHTCMVMGLIMYYTPICLQRQCIFQRSSVRDYIDFVCYAWHSGGHICRCNCNTNCISFTKSIA